MAGSRMKFVAGALAVIALAACWFALGLRSTPLDRSRAAYDRGDYREARALAVEILTKSPDDLDALRLMARASARLGNDETAQTLYSRIGEGSMEAEDFFALGLMLERRGQVPAAVAVLERGVKLGTEHAESLHSLARLYARQGRLPEAIQAAERLSRCTGWEARGSLILGVIDVENVDLPGASAALERALQVDHNLRGGITSSSQARKLLAGALLRTSKGDEALEALGPLLASGDNPEVSWLSARAFLQKKDIARAKEALALAGDFGKDDPTRPDPAPYVGASACANCHASIYQAQRGSRHSRTFFDTADLKKIALPDGPIADKILPRTSHTLRREGDAIRLTTRTGDKELTALIAYAVGSGGRGLTMVARDEEGMARVCRVSSYLGGTLWDLTSNAADPQPEDANGPLGRPMSRSAAEKCVDCHVTSLQAARDRKAPEAADRGIGCERCHGPGGNHLVAMALKFPEPAIARPSRASAEQILKLCGSCHRADDPSMTEADPRFVRFQGSSLPLSRCYTESLGSMSCVTCHNPHRDADPKPATYDARCLDCHGTAPGPASLADRKMRRVPCPVQPASGCVSCHMPKVEGAAPHALFTDHRIRALKPTPRIGE
jgi:tetratricopeptide (TPR) repeat protein